jgi:hypothetical protein
MKGASPSTEEKLRRKVVIAVERLRRFGIRHLSGAWLSVFAARSDIFSRLTVFPSTVHTHLLTVDCTNAGGSPMADEPHAMFGKLTVALVGQYR